DIILDGIDENEEISESARAGVNSLLRSTFRPEFINRLDEIVFFKLLTKSNITKIVDLQVKDLAKRLSDKRINLVVTEAAKDYIIEAAYSPVYGARPIKRFIQSQIETIVARNIISTNPEPGAVITVDYDEHLMIRAS
ncbi:MAG: type VI secretion system ATPase TssH, partial [Clostridia bacterium]|nr:type VI secretion system ATPase TssH [Clostridia bacterium]